jgi:DNA repair protein RadA/Sms
VAKARTEYVCQECGFKTLRPLGRCPECDAWGAFDEVALRTAPVTNGRLALATTPVRLAEIASHDLERIRVQADEFARVTGGGIVKGSLTLIGGDPGVGKSTLLTQIADQIDGTVLYVSAEESISQVGLRARRLGLHSDGLLFLSETDVDAIAETIRQHLPTLAVIDSIQATRAADVEGLPGSVSQLRECALRLLNIAKTNQTAVFLIGHVTKDGAIAGPKVLEHMVDTVLYLEGERFNQYRLLRSTKNRFGPTHEVGVFEMRGAGMVEVLNPSAVFLSERAEQAAGSVVTVAMEGTRPILQELQALVSKSSLAVPRRTATGFDLNRLHLLTAVVSRKAGLPLYDQDVYVNVIGGLRVEEPAADLAAALAIVSSARDHPIPPEVVAVGEVGLAGEVRGVGQLEQRLREAAKLGFRRALVPTTTQPIAGIDLAPVATLREAIRVLSL